MSEASIVSELDPISKLTRDLRDAARTLSDDEARFLVGQTQNANEPSPRPDMMPTQDARMARLKRGTPLIRRAIVRFAGRGR